MGFGAVREPRIARREFVDPKRRTPTVPDVVVMLDETCPLDWVSGRRVVDRHSMVDQISQPEMPAAIRGTAVIHSSVLTMAFPLVL